MSRTLRIGGYAAVALLAAFELWVFWLMLHPDVSANYRSYYITRTSTCLDQPVAGTYELGTSISFRSGGEAAAKPLRVCGWEGPAGDGLHAVGTSSRLRFVPTTEPTGPLKLDLELVAITRDGEALPQQVEVSLNGEPLGELAVKAGVEQQFTLPIPETLRLPADGAYNVLFEYPDAVKMGRDDPDTRWRSIKLTRAALTAG